MGEEYSPPISPCYGFREDEVPRRKTLPEELRGDDDSPPPSPCHGFNPSDFPEPIFVTAELTDDDDVEFIKVVKGKKPRAAVEVKREKVEDDDDIELCYGFDIKDIPKPMIIKEEPEDVTVERGYEQDTLVQVSNQVFYMETDENIEIHTEIEIEKPLSPSKRADNKIIIKPSLPETTNVVETEIVPLDQLTAAVAAAVQPAAAQSVAAVQPAASAQLAAAVQPTAAKPASTSKLLIEAVPLSPKAAVSPQKSALSSGVSVVSSNVQLKAVTVSPRSPAAAASMSSGAPFSPSSNQHTTFTVLSPGKSPSMMKPSTVVGLKEVAVSAGPKEAGLKEVAESQRVTSPTKPPGLVSLRPDSGSPVKSIPMHSPTNLKPSVVSQKVAVSPRSIVISPTKTAATAVSTATSQPVAAAPMSPKSVSVGSPGSGARVLSPASPRQQPSAVGSRIVMTTTGSITSPSVGGSSPRAASAASPRQGGGTAAASMSGTTMETVVHSEKIASDEDGKQVSEQPKDDAGKVRPKKRHLASHIAGPKDRGSSSQMTVRKIVTVPEPHKMKGPHHPPIRKSPASERPIRMITQSTPDNSKPSQQRTPVSNQQTPVGGTQKRTPGGGQSTPPGGRLERIVMNTPRNLQHKKNVEEKSKSVDALAKCIEETIVTEEGMEASAAQQPMVPEETATIIISSQDEAAADEMSMDVQHSQDETVETSEEGATIIIRNETDQLDNKQLAEQHNVVAVEEVEFLENDSEYSQKILVVVGEDGQVVSEASQEDGMEVIESQNIEVSADGRQILKKSEDNVEEVEESSQLERGELGEVVTDEQGNQIVFRKIEDLATGSRRHDKSSDMEKITIIETGDGPGTIKTVKSDEVVAGGRGRLSGGGNIQIIDENGEPIMLVEKEEGDSDTDSDFEDREFTVIVEDEGSDVELESDINLGRLSRLPLEEKNTFEGDTIEDILAQFEKESTNRAVACPNCKKCFVSEHYLRIHISNKTTLCDLCNTQCCTSANLRTHKNVDCDLSIRKRNIDLIAQETELLGKRPIEPEKYYNMPIDSSDEENEQIPRGRIVRNVNDHKYECPECGMYVKILSSHMKYIHHTDKIAPIKTRCSACLVFVSNLANHREMKHNPERTINKLNFDTELVVVRCKHQGCDTFFNSMDELSEHVRREHGEQPRLPCGMGSCDAIFDSRGALRKHRTEVHPELEEFKPVELEPDDPDRDADFTVVCPVCERKFKHKTTCTVHIKVHHLGWVKKKLYNCEDCGKGFDNRKGLEFHREAIHLGIRTICPLCEKPVTRLDLHVRMVHSELPEWPCPDCGKRFKRKFDLNRHRVTVHLGVRNFPCDLCGKRFADMKDMTRHKNAVHYGMKIKWNSKAHKEERRRRKEVAERKKQILENTDKRLKHRASFPMELMETEQESTTLHLTEGDETTLVEESVLDPVYKLGGVREEEELEEVQGESEGVFIQVQDNDHHGGVRFVMFNDDGQIEDSNTTMEIVREDADIVEETEVEHHEVDTQEEIVEQVVDAN